MYQKQFSDKPYVNVVDINFQPLAPTNPGKAGRLLRRGKAIVFQLYPFGIRLKREVPKNEVILSPVGGGN